MSLTQRDVNSRGPLKPILGQRLKPGGGGSARRALSSLGSSNGRENLRLAESLLTISASEFRSKWNFDPLSEKPLAQGQFLWTPVKRPTSKVPLVPKKKDEGVLATCFKLPQKESISRLNSDISTCKVCADSEQSNDQTYNVTIHEEKHKCDVSEVNEQSENQTYNVREPVKQTCEIIEQQDSQTCKEQICESVKETTCCEPNKSDNSINKRKLCEYEENNNLVCQDTSLSKQRQTNITDFLQISKRPESPPKLRRIKSDEDQS